MNGIQEVGGSTPPGSTSLRPPFGGYGPASQPSRTRHFKGKEGGEGCRAEARRAKADRKLKQKFGPPYGGGLRLASQPSRTRRFKEKEGRRLSRRSSKSEGGLAHQGTGAKRSEAIASAIAGDRRAVTSTVSFQSFRKRRHFKITIDPRGVHSCRRNLSALEQEHPPRHARNQWTVYDSPGADNLALAVVRDTGERYGWL